VRGRGCLSKPSEGYQRFRAVVYFALEMDRTGRVVATSVLDGNIGNCASRSWSNLWADKQQLAIHIRKGVAVTRESMTITVNPTGTLNLNIAVSHIMKHGDRPPTVNSLAKLRCDTRRVGELSSKRSGSSEILMNPNARLHSTKRPHGL